MACALNCFIVPVNSQAAWLEFCSTLLVLYLDDYLCSFLTPPDGRRRGRRHRTYAKEDRKNLPWPSTLPHCSCTLCKSDVVQSQTALVDGKRVDDRVVPGQVLDELAILTVPLLDVVRRTRDECVPARIQPARVCTQQHTRGRHGIINPCTRADMKSAVCSS